MEKTKPTQVEAFGQIWRFSPVAMSALKPFGIQTPATLTAFILQLLPTDGMQVGDYYEVDYQRVILSIEVFQNAIEVDHPGDIQSS